MRPPRACALVAAPSKGGSSWPRRHTPGQQRHNRVAGQGCAPGQHARAARQRELTPHSLRSRPARRPWWWRPRRGCWAADSLPGRSAGRVGARPGPAPGWLHIARVQQGCKVGVFWFVSGGGGVVEPAASWLSGTTTAMAQRRSPLTFAPEREREQSSGRQHEAAGWHERAPANRHRQVCVWCSSAQREPAPQGQAGSSGAAAAPCAPAARAPFPAATTNSTPVLLSSWMASNSSCE